MDSFTSRHQDAFITLCVRGLGEPPLSSRSLSPPIASSCLASVRMVRAFTFTPSWVHLSMVPYLAKVFIVRAKGFPGWVLRIAGGVMFSILLGVT